MSEKKFSFEVDEIKVLEQQAKQLTHDRDEKAAKAEQLNAEVFTLRKRLEELEKIISNASTLLLNNKLSQEAYVEGKKNFPPYINKSIASTKCLMFTIERLMKTILSSFLNCKVR